MKTILTTITIVLLSIVTLCKSQQLLLSQDFNFGLSSIWSMNPNSSWTIHPTFGTSGTSCIYTEELNTTSTTVSYVSPTLNLNGLSTLTLNFKGACTKTNFLIPNIAVFYDIGNGKQLLARWGSGFTNPTTYTLNDVADYQYPLDAANIEWVSCSHTFIAPSSGTVAFYFDAEMINAGYVLLDDISLAATNTNVSVGLSETKKDPDLLFFPNPAHDKVTLHSQGIKQIFLLNTLGKVITVPTTYHTDRVELTTESLTKGLYYLHVEKDGLPGTAKLIIE